MTNQINRPNQNANASETGKDSQTRELLLWLEQNPDYAQLVAQAKAGDATAPTSKQRLSDAGKFLLGLVIANPEDFHGKAAVSETLVEHSRLTARLVSVSSLLNFFTNSPLLFFAFKDMGGLAWLMAVVTNGLVLKFTNDTATIVSARKPGSYAWSKLAIGAMLLMNALQSFVAGVGTELLLNQSGLSEFKAELLIEEQAVRIERLKDIPNPKYAEVKLECANGEAELNRMPRNNPRWDSLFVQLYGTWSMGNADWSKIAYDRLPVCRKKERLQEEAYLAYETAKANLEAKLSIRAEMGNDLVFLRREMPLVYQQHFSTEGEIVSGLEAARIAILSFFSKLQSFDFAGLGFPLFFLLLSLITSGYACVLTIAHSGRLDTQQSFSDVVARERDRWLEDRRKEL